MKILLVSMLHDYGDPRRELSYDHYNLHLPLLETGHVIVHYDYMSRYHAIGKETMNQELVTLAEQEAPQLAIFSLYTDQIVPETVERIRRTTKTLGIFYDDTWRVDFTVFWGQRFDFCTSPDVHGEARLARLGVPGCIFLPYGFSPSLYKPLDLPKQYDVSFVGGYHPWRAWLIQKLRRAGIRVAAFGWGWEGGVLPHEKMVEVFNASRINLNMSNSAQWDARYLLASPRGLVNRLHARKTTEQMKARHVEINGCGAFQLSYYVEGLERYYHIGEELGIYLDADDLVAKVRFYLKEDELRESVARAGQVRALADYTHARRFGRLFARLGLDHA